MTIHVILVVEDTGEVQTNELPSADYVLLAWRWSDVLEAIAAGFARKNDTMPLWKVNELAEQAVEVLVEWPLMMKPGQP
jgi:hypothetical protein